METAEFFLIVTPGLEKLALKELQEKWSLLKELLPEDFLENPETKVIHGGIELRAKPGAAWPLNYYLRIPTRILQRVERFMAKDFPKLHQKIRKLPWQEYFRSGTIDVKVATSESRLKIKDRVRETALDALSDAQKHQGFRKKFLEVPQTVFLRIDGDEVTVSVDTSGEALYMRGYKPFSVEAPLRETLGAALFYATQNELGAEPRSVIDPMCGSGTLLWETQFFWRINRSRRYAFENFPSAAGPLASMGLPKILRAVAEISALGIDLSPKAIDAAEKNKATLQKLGGIKAEFRCADVFRSNIEFDHRPGILLVNPPYDERIKVDLEAMAENFKHLLKNLGPNAIGLIWPGDRLPELGAPWAFRIQTTNGGIPIVFGISSQK